ncbi:iqgap- protein [Conglomerata obtusa]
MTNVHESISKEDKPSLQQIDTTRTSNNSYLYLCRLEECRKWLEAMLNKQYRDLTHFEDELPTGIDLCLLALQYAPESIKKIYYGKKNESHTINSSYENQNHDKDDNKNFENEMELDENRLLKDYRYTDNIFFFISSLKTINLPDVFIFDTVSLYERKNIPSVIFCLHGLSHYLKFKGYSNLGIDSVYGMEFSNTLLEEKDKELAQKEKEGVHVPAFSDIKSVMHSDAINEIIFRIKYINYKLNEEAKAEEARREQNLKNELEEQLKLAQNDEKKEYKNELVKTRILHALIDGFTEKSKKIIVGLLKTHIYEKCFYEIFYRNNVSLFAIKYFIFIFYESGLENEKERRIEDLIKSCNIARNRNYKIEEYLEELDVRCNLLTNNKVNISNVSITKPRLEDVLSDNQQYEINDYCLLFYIFQSEPIWFLTLFLHIDKTKEFIFEYVLNFYQGGAKEQYYLANLVQEGMDLVETSNCKNIDDLQDNKIFKSLIILMGNYFRGCTTKFKNDIFHITANLDKIDIENDPSKIYKNIFDVEKTRDEAIENDTVKKIFITRLKTLRAVILSILMLLERNHNELPYSIRMFLKRTYIITDNDYDFTINLFYREFVLPFIIASDIFNSCTVSEELREKFKLVNLVFESIIAEKTSMLFEPLHKFFKEAKEKLVLIINKIINIDENSLEFQCYDSDQINKPFIILTASQANSLIGLVKNVVFKKSTKIKNEFQSIICEEYNCKRMTDNYEHKQVLLNSELFDKVIVVLKNLKTLPNIHKPITFYLNKPIIKEKLPNENIEKLRIAKSKIVELLRIANGRNLYDILVKQSTEEEDYRYKLLIKEIKDKIGDIDESSDEHLFSKSIDYQEKLDNTCNIIKGLNDNKNGNNETLLNNNSYMNDDQKSNDYKDFSEANLNNSKYYTRNDLRNSNINNILLSVNYYCKNEDEYLSIFLNDKKPIKTLSLFKDSIFDDFLKLEENKIINRNNFYNDLLIFLAEDLLKIKFMSNERSKNLEIQTRNLEVLKEKSYFIEKQMRDYESYLASFAKSMLNKKVTNVKGKNCRYGSLRLTGKELQKKEILISMISNTGATNKSYNNKKDNNRNDSRINDGDLNNARINGASIKNATINNATINNASINNSTINNASVIKNDNSILENSDQILKTISTTKDTNERFTLNKKNSNLKDKFNTFGDLNDCIKDLVFIFMCEEPGVIILEISIEKEIICDAIAFRFDELLDQRRKGEKEFIIEGICIMNVCRLIDHLNIKFIK